MSLEVYPLNSFIFLEEFGKDWCKFFIVYFVEFPIEPSGPGHLFPEVFFSFFLFFNRFYFTSSYCSLQITYLFDSVSVSPWFWKYTHFSEFVQFFFIQIDYSILLWLFVFLLSVFYFVWVLLSSSWAWPEVSRFCLSFQRSNSWFHWRLFPIFFF